MSDDSNQQGRSQMWCLFHGSADEQEPAARSIENGADDCPPDCPNCALLKESLELDRRSRELTGRILTLLVKQQVRRGLAEKEKGS